MDGELRWQQLSPAGGAWRPARFAARGTAVGVALGLATVALSALNTISTQQAIAMALPAVLITVGGMAGRIVPDAWRRGFRHGCEAALTSQAYVVRADDAEGKLPEVRVAEVAVVHWSRIALSAVERTAHEPAFEAGAAGAGRRRSCCGAHWPQPRNSHLIRGRP